MVSGGVEFADVSFTVAGGRHLLRGITFRCEPGRTTALLGRSGSGKTTLLRTVNGLVRPSGGRVVVEGRDVLSTDVRTLRRGIGYVIQESGLFPHMSIERNVRLPLEVNSGLHGRSDEVDEAVRQALDRVGLPYAEYKDRFPWQLSGGQRQRAGVARALVNNASVLLMDEPFGALDPLTRAEMQTMLRGLMKAAGTTTLIVTHDLGEALYLADRVVLMDEGAVVADLPAREFSDSSIQAVQQYVQATQPRLDAT